MQQAGAVFELRCDAERQNWRFRWHVAPNGDHARCHALFAKAKADPEFFSLFKVAVYVAIMRAAWQLPEGGR